MVRVVRTQFGSYQPPTPYLLPQSNVGGEVGVDRVPLNSGYISLVYTGIPKLEIEPRLLLVGPALDENFLVSPATNVVLAGYARLDCIVNYKINDTFTAFVHGENLTDTRDETVYNYSTPGVSVYAGLTAKF
jgi:vitamin B12 transporter